MCKSVETTFSGQKIRYASVFSVIWSSGSKTGKNAPSFVTEQLEYKITNKKFGVYNLRTTNKQMFRVILEAGPE